MTDKDRQRLENFIRSCEYTPEEVEAWAAAVAADSSSHSTNSTPFSSPNSAGARKRVRMLPKLHTIKLEQWSELCSQFWRATIDGCRLYQRYDKLEASFLIYVFSSLCSFIVRYLNAAATEEEWIFRGHQLVSKRLLYVFMCFMDAKRCGDMMRGHSDPTVASTLHATMIKVCRETFGIAGDEADDAEALEVAEMNGGAFSAFTQLYIVISNAFRERSDLRQGIGLFDQVPPMTTSSLPLPSPPQQQQQQGSAANGSSTSPMVCQSPALMGGGSSSISAFASGASITTTATADAVQPSSTITTIAASAPPAAVAAAAAPSPFYVNAANVFVLLEHAMECIKAMANCGVPTAAEAVRLLYASKLECKMKVWMEPRGVHLAVMKCAAEAAVKTGAEGTHLVGKALIDNLNAIATATALNELWEAAEAERQRREAAERNIEDSDKRIRAAVAAAKEAAAAAARRTANGDGDEGTDLSAKNTTPIGSPSSSPANNDAPASSSSSSKVYPPPHPLSLPHLIGNTQTSIFNDFPTPAHDQYYTATMTLFCIVKILAESIASVNDLAVTIAAIDLFCGDDGATAANNTSAATATAGATAAPSQQEGGNSSAATAAEGGVGPSPIPATTTNTTATKKRTSFLQLLLLLIRTSGFALTHKAFFGPLLRRSEAIRTNQPLLLYTNNTNINATNEAAMAAGVDGGADFLLSNVSFAGGNATISGQQQQQGFLNNLLTSPRLNSTQTLLNNTLRSYQNAASMTPAAGVGGGAAGASLLPPLPNSSVLGDIPKIACFSPMSPLLSGGNGGVGGGQGDVGGGGARLGMAGGLLSDNNDRGDGDNGNGGDDLMSKDRDTFSNNNTNAKEGGGGASADPTNANTTNNNNTTTAASSTTTTTADAITDDLDLLGAIFVRLSNIHEDLHACLTRGFLKVLHNTRVEPSVRIALLDVFRKAQNACHNPWGVDERKLEALKSVIDLLTLEDFHVLGAGYDEERDAEDFQIFSSIRADASHVLLNRILRRREREQQQQQREGGGSGSASASAAGGSMSFIHQKAASSSSIPGFGVAVGGGEEGATVGSDFATPNQGSLVVVGRGAHQHHHQHHDSSASANPSPTAAAEDDEAEEEDGYSTPLPQVSLDDKERIRIIGISCVEDVVRRIPAPDKAIVCVAQMISTRMRATTAVRVFSVLANILQRGVGVGEGSAPSDNKDSNKGADPSSPTAASPSPSTSGASSSSFSAATIKTLHDLMANVVKRLAKEGRSRFFLPASRATLALDQAHSPVRVGCRGGGAAVVVPPPPNNANVNTAATRKSEKLAFDAADGMMDGMMELTSPEQQRAGNNNNSTTTNGSHHVGPFVSSASPHSAHMSPASAASVAAAEDSAFKAIAYFYDILLRQCDSRVDKDNKDLVEMLRSGDKTIRSFAESVICSAIVGDKIPLSAVPAAATATTATAPAVMTTSAAPATNNVAPPPTANNNPSSLNLPSPAASTTSPPPNPLASPTKPTAGEGEKAGGAAVAVSRDGGGVASAPLSSSTAAESVHGGQSPPRTAATPSTPPPAAAAAATSVSASALLPETVAQQQQQQPTSSAPAPIVSATDRPNSRDAVQVYLSFIHDYPELLNLFVRVLTTSDRATVKRVGKRFDDAGGVDRLVTHMEAAIAATTTRIIEKVVTVRAPPALLVSPSAVVVGNDESKQKKEDGNGVVASPQPSPAKEPSPSSAIAVPPTPTDVAVTRPLAFAMHGDDGEMEMLESEMGSSSGFVSEVANNSIALFSSGHNMTTSSADSSCCHQSEGDASGHSHHHGKSTSPSGSPIRALPPVVTTVPTIASNDGVDTTSTTTANTTATNGVTTTRVSMAIEMPVPIPREEITSWFVLLSVLEDGQMLQGRRVYERLDAAITAAGQWYNRLRDRIASEREAREAAEKRQEEARRHCMESESTAFKALMAEHEAALAALRPSPSSSSPPSIVAHSRTPSAAAEGRQTAPGTRTTSMAGFRVGWAADVETVRSSRRPTGTGGSDLLTSQQASGDFLPPGDGKDPFSVTMGLDSTQDSLAATSNNPFAGFSRGAPHVASMGGYDDPDDVPMTARPKHVHQLSNGSHGGHNRSRSDVSDGSSSPPPPRMRDARRGTEAPTNIAADIARLGHHSDDEDDDDDDEEDADEGSALKKPDNNSNSGSDGSDDGSVVGNKLTTDTTRGAGDTADVMGTKRNGSPPPPPPPSFPYNNTSRRSSEDSDASTLLHAGDEGFENSFHMQSSSNSLAAPKAAPPVVPPLSLKAALANKRKQQQMQQQQQHQQDANATTTNNTTTSVSRSADAYHGLVASGNTSPSQPPLNIGGGGQGRGSDDDDDDDDEYTFHGESIKKIASAASFVLSGSSRGGAADNDGDGTTNQNADLSSFRAFGDDQPSSTLANNDNTNNTGHDVATSLFIASSHRNSQVNALVVGGGAAGSNLKPFPSSSSFGSSPPGAKKGSRQGEDELDLDALLSTDMDKVGGGGGNNSSHHERDGEEGFDASTTPNHPPLVGGVGIGDVPSPITLSLGGGVRGGALGSGEGGDAMLGGGGFASASSAAPPPFASLSMQRNLLEDEKGVRGGAVNFDFDFGPSTGEGAGTGIVIDTAAIIQQNIMQAISNVTAGPEALSPAPTVVKSDADGDADHHHDDDDNSLQRGSVGRSSTADLAMPAVNDTNPEGEVDGVEGGGGLKKQKSVLTAAALQALAKDHAATEQQNSKIPISFVSSHDQDATNNADDVIADVHHHLLLHSANDSFIENLLTRVGGGEGSPHSASRSRGRGGGQNAFELPPTTSTTTVDKNLLRRRSSVAAARRPSSQSLSHSGGDGEYTTTPFSGGAENVGDGNNDEDTTAEEEGEHHPANEDDDADGSDVSDASVVYNEKPKKKSNAGGEDEHHNDDESLAVTAGTVNTLDDTTRVAGAGGSRKSDVDRFFADDDEEDDDGYDDDDEWVVVDEVTPEEDAAACLKEILETIAQCVLDAATGNLVATATTLAAITASSAAIAPSLPIAGGVVGSITSTALVAASGANPTNNNTTAAAPPANQLVTTSSAATNGSPSSLARERFGDRYSIAVPFAPVKPSFLNLIPSLHAAVNDENFVRAATALIAEGRSIDSSVLVDYAIQYEKPELLNSLQVPADRLFSLPMDQYNPHKVLTFWHPLIMNGPLRSEVRFQAHGGVAVNTVLQSMYAMAPLSHYFGPSSSSSSSAGGGNKDDLLLSKKDGDGAKKSGESGKDASKDAASSAADTNGSAAAAAPPKEKKTFARHNDPLGKLIDEGVAQLHRFGTTPLLGASLPTGGPLPSVLRDGPSDSKSQFEGGANTTATNNKKEGATADKDKDKEDKAGKEGGAKLVKDSLAMPVVNMNEFTGFTIGFWYAVTAVAKENSGGEAVVDPSSSTTVVPEGVVQPSSATAGAPQDITANSNASPNLHASAYATENTTNAAGPLSLASDGSVFSPPSTTTAQSPSLSPFATTTTVHQQRNKRGEQYEMPATIPLLELGFCNNTRMVLTIRDTDRIEAVLMQDTVEVIAAGGGGAVNASSTPAAPLAPPSVGPTTNPAVASLLSASSAIAMGGALASTSVVNASLATLGGLSTATVGGLPLTMAAASTAQVSNAAGSGGSAAVPATPLPSVSAAAAAAVAAGATTKVTSKKLFTRTVNEDRPLHCLASNAWVYFAFVCTPVGTNTRQLLSGGNAANASSAGPSLPSTTASDDSNSTVYQMTVFAQGRVIGTVPIATQAASLTSPPLMVGQALQALIGPAAANGRIDKALFSIGEVTVWNECLSLRALHGAMFGGPIEVNPRKRVPHEAFAVLDEVGPAPVLSMSGRFVPHKVCIGPTGGTARSSQLRNIAVYASTSGAPPPTTAHVVGHHFPTPKEFVEPRMLFVTLGGMRFLLQWMMRGAEAASRHALMKGGLGGVGNTIGGGGKNIVDEALLKYAFQIYIEIGRNVTYVETLRPGMYCQLALILKKLGKRVDREMARLILRLAAEPIRISSDKDKQRKHKKAFVIINKHAVEYILADVQLYEYLDSEVSIEMLATMESFFSSKDPELAPYAKTNSEAVMGQRFTDRLLQGCIFAADVLPLRVINAIAAVLKASVTSRGFPLPLIQSVVFSCAQMMMMPSSTDGNNAVGSGGATPAARDSGLAMDETFRSNKDIRGSGVVNASFDMLSGSDIMMGTGGGDLNLTLRSLGLTPPADAAPRELGEAQLVLIRLLLKMLAEAVPLKGFMDNFIKTVSVTWFASLFTHLRAGDEAVLYAVELLAVCLEYNPPASAATSASTSAASKAVAAAASAVASATATIAAVAAGTVGEGAAAGGGAGGSAGTAAVGGAAAVISSAAAAVSSKADKLSSAVSGPQVPVNTLREEYESNPFVLRAAVERHNLPVGALMVLLAGSVGKALTMVSAIQTKGGLQAAATIAGMMTGVVGSTTSGTPAPTATAAAATAPSSSLPKQTMGGGTGGGGASAVANVFAAAISPQPPVGGGASSAPISPDAYLTTQPFGGNSVQSPSSLAVAAAAAAAASSSPACAPSPSSASSPSQQPTTAYTTPSGVTLDVPAVIVPDASMLSLITIAKGVLDDRSKWKGNKALASLFALAMVRFLDNEAAAAKTLAAGRKMAAIAAATEEQYMIRKAREEREAAALLTKQQQQQAEEEALRRQLQEEGGGAVAAGAQLSGTTHSTPIFGMTPIDSGALLGVGAGGATNLMLRGPSELTLLSSHPDQDGILVDGVIVSASSPSAAAASAMSVPMFPNASSAASVPSSVPTALNEATLSQPAASPIDEAPQTEAPPLPPPTVFIPSDGAKEISVYLLTVLKEALQYCPEAVYCAFTGGRSQLACYVRFITASETLASALIAELMPAPPRPVEEPITAVPSSKRLLAASSLSLAKASTLSNAITNVASSPLPAVASSSPAPPPPPPPTSSQTLGDPTAAGATTSIVVARETSPFTAATDGGAAKPLFPATVATLSPSGELVLALEPPTPLTGTTTTAFQHHHHHHTTTAVSDGTGMGLGATFCSEVSSLDLHHNHSHHQSHSHSHNHQDNPTLMLALASSSPQPLLHHDVTMVHFDGQSHHPNNQPIHPYQVFDDRRESTNFSIGGTDNNTATNDGDIIGGSAPQAGSGIGMFSPNINTNNACNNGQQQPRQCLPFSTSELSRRQSEVVFLDPSSPNRNSRGPTASKDNNNGGGVAFPAGGGSVAVIDASEQSMRSQKDIPIPFGTTPPSSVMGGGFPSAAATANATQEYDVEGNTTEDGDGEDNTMIGQSANTDGRFGTGLLGGVGNKSFSPQPPIAIYAGLLALCPEVQTAAMDVAKALVKASLTLHVTEEKESTAGGGAGGGGATGGSSSKEGAGEKGPSSSASASKKEDVDKPHHHHHGYFPTLAAIMPSTVADLLSHRLGPCGKLAFDLCMSCTADNAIATVTRFISAVAIGTMSASPLKKKGDDEAMEANIVGFIEFLADQLIYATRSYDMSTTEWTLEVLHRVTRRITTLYRKRAEKARDLALRGAITVLGAKDGQGALMISAAPLSMWETVRMLVTECYTDDYYNPNRVSQLFYVLYKAYRYREVDPQQLLLTTTATTTAAAAGVGVGNSSNALFGRRPSFYASPSQAITQQQQQQQLTNASLPPPSLGNTLLTVPTGGGAAMMAAANTPASAHSSRLPSPNLNPTSSADAPVPEQLAVGPPLGDSAATVATSTTTAVSADNNNALSNDGTATAVAGTTATTASMSAALPPPAALPTIQTVAVSSGHATPLSVSTPRAPSLVVMPPLPQGGTTMMLSRQGSQVQQQQQQSDEQHTPVDGPPRINSPPPLQQQQQQKQEGAFGRVSSARAANISEGGGVGGGGGDANRQFTPPFGVIVPSPSDVGPVVAAGAGGGMHLSNASFGFPSRPMTTTTAVVNGGGGTNATNASGDAFQSTNDVMGSMASRRDSYVPPTNSFLLNATTTASQQQQQRNSSVTAAAGDVLSPTPPAAVPTSSAAATAITTTMDIIDAAATIEDAATTTPSVLMAACGLSARRQLIVHMLKTIVSAAHTVLKAHLYIPGTLLGQSGTSCVGAFEHLLKDDYAMFREAMQGREVETIINKGPPHAKHRLLEKALEEYRHRFAEEKRLVLSAISKALRDPIQLAKELATLENGYMSQFSSEVEDLDALRTDDLIWLKLNDYVGEVNISSNAAFLSAAEAEGVVTRNRAVSFRNLSAAAAAAEAAMAAATCKRHYIDRRRNIVPFEGTGLMAAATVSGSKRGMNEMQASINEELVSHISVYIPSVLRRVPPYGTLSPPWLTKDLPQRLTPSAMTLLQYIMNTNEKLYFITNGFKVEGIDCVPVLIVLTDCSLKLFAYSRINAAGDVFIAQRPAPKDDMDGNGGGNAMEEEEAPRASGLAAINPAQSFAATQFKRFQRWVKDTDKKVSIGEKVSKSVARLSSDTNRGMCWLYDVHVMRSARLCSYLHQDVAVDISITWDAGPMIAIMDEHLAMTKDARKQFTKALAKVCLRVNESFVLVDDEETIKTHFKLWQGMYQTPWVNRSLSTYDYLTQINNVCGRALKDWNQYPVFPWIIKDYTAEVLDLTSPDTFRDLEWPIHAQTPDARGTAEMRFTELTNDEQEPWHHATHYTSSAAVLYFMLRLQPYLTSSAAYQGGRLDHADRLFRDVATAYRNAVTSSADCKELLPDFYANGGTFLKNIDQIDLGTLQNETRLNDVELPPWAKKSQRVFTFLMRQALESEYVSMRIHKWIDLVFGSCQTGEGAVRSFNVHKPLTYPEEVKKRIAKETTDLGRSQILCEVQNFGQSPRVIFSADHPKRLSAAEVAKSSVTYFMLNSPSQYGMCEPTNLFRTPPSLIQQYHAAAIRSAAATPVVNSVSQNTAATPTTIATTTTIRLANNAASTVGVNMEAAIAASGAAPITPSSTSYDAAAVAVVSSALSGGPIVAPIRKLTQYEHVQSSIKGDRLTFSTDYVIPVSRTDHCICFVPDEFKFYKHSMLDGRFIEAITLPTAISCRVSAIVAMNLQAAFIIGTSTGQIFTVVVETVLTVAYVSNFLTAHSNPIVGIQPCPDSNTFITHTSCVDDEPAVWRYLRRSPALLCRIGFNAAIGQKAVVKATCIDRRDTSYIIASDQHVAVFDAQGVVMGSGCMPADRAFPSITAVAVLEASEWVENGTMVYVTGHEGGYLGMWRVVRRNPQTITPERLVDIYFAQFLHPDDKGDVGDSTITALHVANNGTITIGRRNGKIKTMFITVPLQQTAAAAAAATAPTTASAAAAEKSSAATASSTTASFAAAPKTAPAAAQLTSSNSVVATPSGPTVPPLPTSASANNTVPQAGGGGSGGAAAVQSSQPQQHGGGAAAVQSSQQVEKETPRQVDNSIET